MAAVAASASSVFRKGYLPTEIRREMIEVAERVEIYVEQSGNIQSGIPVVFVHGGPGWHIRTIADDADSGKGNDHQWFNPGKYRVIAFQQRGTRDCKPTVYDHSTHPREFKDVTIQTLAEDMETLRKKLSIDKWLVFGGSWGSALTMFYGQEYPASCLGLVIRGVFMVTPYENARFFSKERYDAQGKKTGNMWDPRALDRVVDYARKKFPDLQIDLEHTENIYEAYSRLCVLEDDRVAQKIWTNFEAYVDDPAGAPEEYAKLMSDELDITNDDHCVGVWEPLLMNSVAKTYNLVDPARLARLQGMPVQVVNGEDDSVCEAAFAERVAADLVKAGCLAKCAIVPGGPHSPFHDGMTDALVRATDTFAEHSHF
jgi:proline iminopeptidase